MAIVEAINIPIGVTGQETVQQAANSYEDLGDAVAKTQLEAERLAQQFGINDQRTQEAIKVAGKYKQQMEELDFAIDGARGGVDTMVRATQGVIAGFEVAVGAAALFGSESEELEKVLMKVQGAMALSQGIKDFKEFLPAITATATAIRTKLVTALTTLKGAIIATGIGALVVAIAAAIEAIGQYNDELDKTIDKELELAKIRKKEAVESLDVETRAYQSATEIRLLLAQKEGKSAQQIADLEIKLLKERRTQLREFYANDKNEQEARAKALQEYNKVSDNVTKLQIQRDIQIVNSAKERLKAESEFKQNMFALQVQEIFDNKKLLQEIEQLERQYLLDKYDPNGDYVRIRQAGRIFANKEAEEQAQIEYLNLQEQKRKELELLEEAYLKDLISKESYEKKKAELDGYYKDLEFKRTQELAQRQRDTQEEFAIGTTQMLLDLNNIFQGQKEDQSRQEFEREKALQIGQTLIGTYFAAQRAYASQINPLDPTSPIRAGLAAAFATASGLARVATIRRVRYNDPNAPTGASNTGGGISQTVPRFNAPTTRLPQTDEFTQVRRVYVTERDITNVQDKVRVTESLSQF